MTLKKLVLSTLGAVAVALLAAGATLWRASAREDVARAAYPPQGQFVIVEGLRVHAIVAGQGPDLVLIHGASGSTRDFSFDFIARLTDRYRVIAFDRPGLGWSDPAPDGHSLHVQARILQLAAAQLGADKPIVVGHSYGGAVALAWAVDHPADLAALVIVSAPSHPWPTPLPLLYRLTAPALGQNLLVPLITAFVPATVVDRAVADTFLPQAQPPGYADHFGPVMSLRRGPFRVNARQRAALLAEITAMVPSYPAITVPIESLHGTADDIVDLGIHAERLQREVSGVNLRRLPGIGHMPHHSVPDQVVAAIDRAAGRVGSP